MINPGSIFKMKGLWDRFVDNHPKFPMFLNACKGSDLGAGTIIEIHLTTADGKDLTTNVKLTESDVELFEELKNLSK